MFKRPNDCYHRIEFGCDDGDECYCRQNYNRPSAVLCRNWRPIVWLAYCALIVGGLYAYSAL